MASVCKEPRVPAAARLRLMLLALVHLSVRVRRVVGVHALHHPGQRLAIRIERRVSAADFLAIQGGSNGGLLIGACMTQRPDLFKVTIPQVGVMDMLRYHKFTIGYAWATEYGSSDKPEQFKYLYKYSPLHNLKKGVKYPATLVTTADHDDRVVPAHSFKFAATLQEDNGGDNPALIRIETKAGHGAGMPTSKRIELTTDIWSFVMYNLDMNFREQSTASQKEGKKAF